MLQTSLCNKTTRMRLYIKKIIHWTAKMYNQNDTLEKKTLKTMEQTWADYDDSQTCMALS